MLIRTRTSSQISNHPSLGHQQLPTQFVLDNREESKESYDYEINIYFHGKTFGTKTIFIEILRESWYSSNSSHALFEVMPGVEDSMC